MEKKFKKIKIEKEESKYPESYNMIVEYDDLMA